MGLQKFGPWSPKVLFWYTVIDQVHCGIPLGKLLSNKNGPLSQIMICDNSDATFFEGTWKHSEFSQLGPHMSFGYVVKCVILGFLLSSRRIIYTHLCTDM